MLQCSAQTTAMAFQSNSKRAKCLKILALSGLMLLSACQPQSDDPARTDSKSVTQTKASAEQQGNFYLEAKTVVLKPTQAQSCDESGCTRYQFQTVDTNQAWLNDYFKQRIEKSNPLAFTATTAAHPQANDQNISQSSVVVRYMGQNQHIASFELSTTEYSAGAAHGMYHNEYVNFDLKQKKRITVQDLTAEGATQKLTDALYDHNSMWLSDHSIEREKLQLSDNFYYGADGLVFVYPLYELASYAEGMSELELPYYSTRDLIRTEYLPNLPQYPNAD